MRSGARASRHPPRWRAQSDTPATGGTRAADWAVAAAQSAVSFQGRGLLQRAGATGKGSRNVVRRFRGESHHKVDGKGRVSIPASFRRVLEAGDPAWTEGLNPELVIVYGDHRRAYLECYTMDAIAEVDAKIDALPRGSMERKMLQRLFHGQSFPTAVDETGRLVLPAKLRQKIDLQDEAFFIAAGDTFQIWKPETYEQEELAKTDAWLDDLPDDFDPLILLDGGKAG